ncbi:diacylglycerol kinase family protein [Patescibacteria group bacterium]|nr:diacylglycerol kinase family protein [Patescibacteria group bacterium]
MVTVASFKYAFRGLGAVISSERNAKIHLGFAILAIFLSVVLRVSALEFLFVFSSIVMVFFSEIVNTSIEKSLDLISQENNHLVQLIKDMMAAAVLVTALGAVVVAGVVFGPRFYQLLIGLINK